MLVQARMEETRILEEVAAEMGHPPRVAVTAFTEEQAEAVGALAEATPGSEAEEEAEALLPQEPLFQAVRQPSVVMAA